MPDMEKVIEGLEVIKQFFGYGLPSTAEMFDSYYGILNDAQKLLKEQEAVEPTWQHGKAYCGSCGKRIPLKIGARYCHKCGKAVKWDG